MQRMTSNFRKNDIKKNGYDVIVAVDNSVDFVDYLNF